MTTEKDLVRIARPPDGPPLYALVQEIVFPDGHDLGGFVLDRLASLRRGASRP